MRFICLLLVIFLMGCTTPAPVESKREIASMCGYGKPDSCAQGEFCINVDKDKTACRANPSVDLLTLKFPFGSSRQATCDQGPLSPPNNSHTWANTAYAVDLQSDRKLKDAIVFSGAKGRVVVFDECETENDSCGMGFGNSVKVFTDGGHILFYAHLKRASVKTGDLVTNGQKIGIEGVTGATGKDNRHVHLSVHYDWRPQGFDYWKQTGYLPPSVPFKLEVCANECSEKKQARCQMMEVDVHDLKCNRTSAEAKPLCAN